MAYYKKHGLAVEGLTVTARTTKRRDIYLHPSVRTDWGLIGHEMVHAFLEEMGEHQRRKGYIKRPLTHKQIEKLGVPLGEFLRQNW